MRCSEFLYPASIARCQHIKVNGTQCGSPALKDRKFCYFHQQWQQRRIQLSANRARRSRYSLDLPILEDANSIQVALMQAMRLLLTQQVDHKTAALLFYALQTASSNLRHTEFEPAPQRVVIDPRGVSNTALGDDAWYKQEFSDSENKDNKDEEEEAGQAEAHHNTPETVNLQAVACSRRDGRPRPSRRVLRRVRKMANQRCEEDRKGMVEAAGVEPASENVTGQETTCLFRFMPQALP